MCFISTSEIPFLYFGQINGAIALSYPPIVIDDSSWKNAAESFTVALTLTLGAGGGGGYKKCNSAKLIWFEIFILHHYMWNVLLYFLTVLLITTCIFSAYFDLPLIYCLCDYYTMHNNCFKRVLCKREGGRMVYLFTLRKLFCTSQYEKNRTN